jgi:hypothetical protein
MRDWRSCGVIYVFIRFGRRHFAIHFAIIFEPLKPTRASGDLSREFRCEQSI